jgi:hypothetical protein
MFKVNYQLYMEPLTYEHDNVHPLPLPSLPRLTILHSLYTTSTWKSKPIYIYLADISFKIYIFALT